MEKTLVLVQTDASLELLLGTDVLAQLGFYLLEVPHGNGHMTELLKGDMWQEVEDTSSTSALQVDTPAFVPASPSTITTESPEAKLQQTTEVKEIGQNVVSLVQHSLLEDKQEEAERGAQGPEIEVKLLEDTKIPGQHAKVVRVKIVNPEQLKKISVNMLIPRRNTLLEEGIVVTNSLIHSDPEGCFKIIMENYSLNSVHLSRGQEVGVLKLVTLIPWRESQVGRTYN